MMEQKFSCDAAKQYFNSLPISLQENINQAGIDCLNEQELRAYAAQILGQPQAES